jgi:hypothetical protein
MNRRHVVSFASLFSPVAIGLIIGLAAPGSALASTRDAATGSAPAAPAAATAITARAAAPRLVVLGCNNAPEVTPPGITSCTDRTLGLRGVHWTSWTPQLASGFGTYVLKDARGHLQSYPALVALWGSAAVKGHPAERKYTQLTLIFTGTRPPDYQLVNGKTVVTHPVTLTLPTFP